jgi:hypothetical protein
MRKEMMGEAKRCRGVAHVLRTRSDVWCSHTRCISAALFLFLAGVLLLLLFLFWFDAQAASLADAQTQHSTSGDHPRHV